jgi:hypothetical protein
MLLCHIYKYNLAFSNNNSEYFNESDEDIFGNRIIILKRVKSLKQLRRTEKELVRLNYKEAIIKGFTLKGIQQYIATKTKIWVEWSCMEYLKKAEDQENREWYYHMARDHFAYVGAYRKCIDELDILKKEMWNIIMDSKAEMYSRVQATKELHSLSKTSVLLLRDLPFVTNLSKFYDLSDGNEYLSDKPSLINYNNGSLNPVNNPLIKEEIQEVEKSNNPFPNDVVSKKAIIKTSGPRVDNELPSKYKNLDDRINEDMQRQLHIKDSLKNKRMDEITDEDLNKVITPEHEESIRRLRELLDD